MSGRGDRREGERRPRGPGSIAEARKVLWHLRQGGVGQVRTHLRRRRGLDAAGPADSVWIKDGLAFDPWPVPDRPPVRSLWVGVILDDFSRLAFAPEWHQVELDPATWREQLAEGLDLVFVESAWSGNGGVWRHYLAGDSAPHHDLVDMVAACREAGVPTVFWNKEDPPHFEHFLATAKLFDRVYTTDVNRVPAYLETLGHDRVGVLPFAAQPAIHNPIRLHDAGATRDVAFAGRYVAHKYPERRAQMNMLLGAALDASADMATGLEIFARFHDWDERYQFPEPLASRVVGSLDYPRMLSAYRGYKVFLNVNSVVDSPSMCARRIFEISACGTPVVSTPSAAVGEFFAGDEVFVAGNRAQTGALIRVLVDSPELRDRAVHLAQRRIWREHTYGARVQQVLHDVGLALWPRVARPRVTALVSTDRPSRLEGVLASVGAQQGVDVQLALLTHGFEVDAEDLRVRAKEAGIEYLVLLHAGTDVPLGECLNRLVAAADGDVVAVMGDEDLYGPQYLSDQLYAMDYSGADVVGKQAHYVYLESVGATLLRFPEREHHFTDLVTGPTIMAHREAALASPFPAVGRGEDTAGFLRGVIDAGGRVYSADRFNFMQVRGGNRGGQAPSVTDAELLASSDVTFYGRSDAHVLV